jgi:hypothetical protein
MRLKDEEIKSAVEWERESQVSQNPKKHGQPQDPSNMSIASTSSTTKSGDDEEFTFENSRNDKEK